VDCLGAVSWWRAAALWNELFYLLAIRASRCTRRTDSAAFPAWTDVTKPRCIIVMAGEHYPHVFGPSDLARLRELVDLRPELIEGEEFENHAQDYEETELLVGGWEMPQLTAALLARLPKLRAVFYAAGTIKGIVTDTSWERGIRITTAALENAKPTAEFAFAQIILSLKRGWQRMFLMREKRQFVQRDPLVTGTNGSTVGLLALGKIGRLVAARLHTLDVNVIAYDPFVVPAEATRLGVRLCGLEELFATADVVSCHLPSTDQTQRLLGRALFARLKPGATFINTARGSVVNEAELVAVLRQRPDLFAALDVTDHEPPPPDDPLFELDNVLLTPHIAGSTALECRRMGHMMVEEVDRYLTGKPLLGEVFQQQLATMA
jgi:phosphoglycerate dehydrogenase-like enzyme